MQNISVNHVCLACEPLNFVNFVSNNMNKNKYFNKFVLYLEGYGR